MAHLKQRPRATAQASPYKNIDTDNCFTKSKKMLLLQRKAITNHGWL